MYMYIHTYIYTHTHIVSLARLTARQSADRTQCACRAADRSDRCNAAASGGERASVRVRARSPFVRARRRASVLVCARARASHWLGPCHARTAVPAVITSSSSRIRPFSSLQAPRVSTP